MSSIEDYVSFKKPLLPLEKLQTLGQTHAQAYQNAQPFPHIVVDDFLDPVILERVLEEFPGEGNIDWQRFNNKKTEVKLASKSELQIGLFTRYLLYSLNSSAFLHFLEQVTGIKGLVPDPHLWGGGLHQIMPGGKLGVHTDFNRYEHLKLDRRLNVLIYLNRDWDEAWGGHLELWDRNMKERGQRLAPVFNRMVCFSTTDFTYHGHPDPLQCPPGRSRRSLALYYYSNGRPAEEVTESHDTVFQRRPTDPVEAVDWRAKLKPREVARKFIPPILLDLRRMLKQQ